MVPWVAPHPVQCTDNPLCRLSGGPVIIVPWWFSCLAYLSTRPCTDVNMPANAAYAPGPWLTSLNPKSNTKITGHGPASAQGSAQLEVVAFAPKPAIEPLTTA